MTLTVPEIKQLLADATPKDGTFAGGYGASQRLRNAAPDLAHLAIDQARELAVANARIDRMDIAIEILEDALQEAGDDYPGSSMQKWAQQRVKAARAALKEQTK